jgi:ferric-dicitrate binding protein FerR (iron transport regulator)
MNDSDLETQAAAPAHDPLGELIRAAGRRPPPPREHYESVLAASRSAWQSKVRARRRRQWFALAAAVVLAVGSAVTFQAVQRIAPTPAATLAAAGGEIALFSSATGMWQPLTDVDARIFPGDRLRTGADGRAALATPGGRSLRIDSDTELTLDGSSSVELVAGTLYVDSGRATSVNAIEIATPFGKVRDIGTQFEVRSSAESLRVRVRSGVVELVQSAYAADFRSPAGAEFELLTSGAVQLREIAPDDDQWDWAATLAVAPDNQSILGYLQWIAHETGKSLRFDSPNTELRAQLVSFKADARGFTPLEILESIKETSDFTYELTGDGAILVRRSESLP